MSNSNDDRRPIQPDDGEKGSKGQQQGGGQGKSSGGQQGGKEEKGGQTRQGSTGDDDKHRADRSTQQPNKSGDPGNYINDNDRDNEARRKGI